MILEKKEVNACYVIHRIFVNMENSYQGVISAILKRGADTEEDVKIVSIVEVLSVCMAGIKKSVKFARDQIPIWKSSQSSQSSQCFKRLEHKQFYHRV
jgi:hypothetical protein